MSLIKLKAPRIYHLPWSEHLNSDDKKVITTNMFNNKQVVITLKFDGESTSLYNDGTFHARSLDSKQHNSRDWLYDWWRHKLYSDDYALLLHNRYKDLRLVGENMYATHTIQYNNLNSLFLLHSAWNGTTCLSWQDTLDVAFILNITTVSVLYQGLYDEDKVKQFNKLDYYNGDLVEGYVIRNSESFSYIESNNNVAKFVSSRFNIKGNHWSKEGLIRNKLK